MTGYGALRVTQAAWLMNIEETMYAASPNRMYASEDASISTWENVVIFNLHRELTIDALRASVEANRTLAARYPGNVASLALSSFGVSLPAADVRKAAAQAIADARDNLVCAAQVLGGDGFWASAARSVITAIELMRPDDRPRRTFGRLPEATRWLALQLKKDAVFVRALELAVTQTLPDQRSGATPAAL